MLRGNLSTRPFYNERAVQVLLALAAVILVALSVFSARQFLTLSAQQGDLSAKIAVDDQRTEALRRDAATVRRGIDDAELRVTVAATREVNHAIDQRVFSWTALFNTIERTIPAAVVLRGVYPQIAEDRSVTVRLLVNASRIEDVGAFMDALERAQTFRGLQSTEEQRMEDGTFDVAFDGEYLGEAGPPGTAADTAGAAPGVEGR